MKNIILLGFGGHFNSCSEVIENENKFKIAGFVTNKTIHHKNYFGNNYRYLGSDKDLKKLKKHFEYAFIAIGQIKSAKRRKNLFEKLSQLSFKIPIIISPNSNISKYISINDGTIVMNGVNINRYVKIGKNCIINSNVLIEHDSVIGNHTHVSTGAIINGNVKIGNACFIGSKAILHNNITIGDNCIIGAGSIVDRDIPSYSNIYPYFKKKIFLINNYFLNYEYIKKTSAGKLKILAFLRYDCNYSKLLRDFLKNSNNDITIIWSKKRKETMPSISYKWSGDYIFCFRSHFILPKSIIEKAKFAINFHPGPPNYRGSGCVNYAIKNKEKKYGITCHLMDEKIDHGSIIDVKSFILKKNYDVKDTLKITHEKLFKQAKKIINSIINGDEKYILKKINDNKHIRWSGGLKTMKKLDSLKYVSIKETTKDLDHKIRYLHTDNFPLILKYKKYNFKLITNKKDIK